MAHGLLRLAANVEERLDTDSTLIRRGRSALSMSEMVAFVDMLETRPLFKLLEELPELARLSDAKFTLAVKTLRRRFRGESVVDQMQLRIVAHEVAQSIDDSDAAGRVRGLFV
jgi:hypothetical protein